MIHLQGSVLTPPAIGMDYYENGSVLINNSGKIEYAGPGINDESHVVYGGKEFLITPGFIDLHTHFPQFPAAGLGKGNLSEWLNELIFPLEAAVSDIDFAGKISNVFFKSLIRNGTTTAVVYGPSSIKATEAAFLEAESSGMRVFMGNSLMDTNCPAEIKNSTGSSLESIQYLAIKYHENNEGLINYIITLRYAGSCSAELMAKASETARREGMLLQTHLSESKAEIEMVMKLFPEAKNYTDIYKKYGVLGENTILAHCIHLNDEEIDRIKNNGCAIAHCPTSNRFLASGFMPALKYMDKGLMIGLGTDIAAGYNESVPREAAEAIETSKALNIKDEIYSANVLSAEDAFRMATINSAEILGIAGITGSIENGKDADLVLHKLNNPLPFDLFAGKETALRHFMYRRDDYSVDKVFVRGKDIL
ncbi:MAG: amidohydrolase family protein [Candidatus Kapaibacterium sp.]